MFTMRRYYCPPLQCRPYHFHDRILLMGDAAHAMVPFYGQGMNAGFEDCSVLSALLGRQEWAGDWGDVLREYSRVRWEDAHAICDLAMYNYTEMRDLVNRPSYRVRKALDDLLNCVWPGGWVPLYNSVSFTSMPYKQCIANRRWQDKIISRALWSSVVAVAVAAVAAKTLFSWA